MCVSVCMSVHTRMCVCVDLDPSLPGPQTVPLSFPTRNRSHRTVGRGEVRGPDLVEMFQPVSLSSFPDRTRDGTVSTLNCLRVKTRIPTRPRGRSVPTCTGLSIVPTKISPVPTLPRTSGESRDGPGTPNAPTVSVDGCRQVYTGSDPTPCRTPPCVIGQDDPLVRRFPSGTTVRPSSPSPGRPTLRPTPDPGPSRHPSAT